MPPGTPITTSPLARSPDTSIERIIRRKAAKTPPSVFFMLICSHLQIFSYIGNPIVSSTTIKEIKSTARSARNPIKEYLQSLFTLFPFFSVRIFSSIRSAMVL
jgi:hypothetical protein